MTRPLILTTTAATALSACTVTAVAWADTWPITTAACVICVLLINLAGGEIIKDWRGK